MSKIIKMENISIKRKEGHEHEVRGSDRFCPVCGEDLREDVIVEEHVCENCRHLVKPDDKFCWKCGASLEASDEVEHWEKGNRLTNTRFGERKTEIRGL